MHTHSKRKPINDGRKLRNSEAYFHAALKKKPLSLCCTKEKYQKEIGITKYYLYLIFSSETCKKKKKVSGGWGCQNPYKIIFTKIFPN